MLRLKWRLYYMYRFGAKREKTNQTIHSIYGWESFSSDYVAISQDCKVVIVINVYRQGLYYENTSTYLLYTEFFLTNQVSVNSYT